MTYQDLASSAAMNERLISLPRRPWHSSNWEINKIMRMLIVVLALSGVLAVLPANSQSLVETTNWIHKSLEPRGTTRWDRNGYSAVFPPAGGETEELVSSFIAEGCNVRVVVEQQLTSIPLLGDSNAEYVYTFSLGDIDPRSFKADEVGRYSIYADVSFSTTNAHKTISCTSTYIDKNFERKKTRCMPEVSDEIELRLSMRDQYASRFTKAMRHAVALCGGKPSTF